MNGCRSIVCGAKPKCNSRPFQCANWLPALSSKTPLAVLNAKAGTGAVARRDGASKPLALHQRLNGIHVSAKWLVRNGPWRAGGFVERCADAGGFGAGGGACAIG